MEVQWPLVFFTLFTGMGADAFSCVAFTEWMGIAESLRMPGAISALVAMAMGGVSGTLHLSHPSRTRHIVKHLGTGIGKEMLLIGFTGLQILIYTIMLFLGFGDGARKLVALFGLIYGGWCCPLKWVRSMCFLQGLHGIPGSGPLCMPLRPRLRVYS